MTAGDVWLFDPDTRILVAGDLVTLPAPLLDTACPARWQASLDPLAQTDFALLVPGHGPAMSRADFDAYRHAFAGLLSCAASDQAKEACIGGWLSDVGKLVPEPDQALARSLLDYYLDNHLRADPARTAELCGG